MKLSKNDEKERIRMKKYEMQIVAICEKTVTVYAEHETAAKEMIQ